MTTTKSPHAEPKPTRRWFHLTPGRCLAALLAVEALLWLSERFGWLPWHKGYAVLTALAVVAVVILAMFLWFAVALVFRRRFQFSIRSLLLLVVVVALPCSWLATEIGKTELRRAAVGEIQSAGGFVVYDYQVIEVPPNRFHDSSLTPLAPGWLRAMTGDDYFGDAAEVFCESAMIRDTDLKHLGRLQGLVDICLTGATVTDSTLEHVDGMHELQELSLDRTMVTDAGLKHLAGLARLKRLDLDLTKVTDAGLESLTGLIRLERLRLGGTKITDNGLERLKRLSQLQQLWLNDTNVTNAGVKKLQRALPNCKIYWEPPTLPAR